MSRPVVSAIVPTYNRSLIVGRAIDSALHQSHPSIEVVVVDDGSTDDTAAVIAASYRHDPRVRYLRIDNAGPAGARNAGLAIATGTHIAFLDSDDAWLPWKTEFQLRWLEALPAVGMIWTDMAAMDGSGRRLADRYLRTFYKRHSEVSIESLLETITLAGPEGGRVAAYHGDLYRAMLLGNLVHTSTVLMTRERLEAVGGFDQDLKRSGEDFDFHLRTCRAGPVAFADVSTIEYQIGEPDQLTRQDLMVQMAHNYLTTIEKAVAADAARTPVKLHRMATARAHAWLGAELLTAGDRRDARHHLRRGLPGSRLVGVARLALAWLPHPIATVLRGMANRLLSPWLRRRAG